MDAGVLGAGLGTLLTTVVKPLLDGRSARSQAAATTAATAAAAAAARVERLEAQVHTDGVELARLATENDALRGQVVRHAGLLSGWERRCSSLELALDDAGQHPSQVHPARPDGSAPAHRGNVRTEPTEAATPPLGTPPRAPRR